MKLKTLSTLLLAVAFAAAATGCKKKMDRVTPLPGYGPGAAIRDPGLSGLNTNPTQPGDGTTGTGVKPGPDGQIPLSGARNIEGRPQDREKFKAYVVFFDFDRSTVKPGEVTKVQEVAVQFKAGDEKTDLLIEGHCDERGTEEYNRSLGERRALALRELLVASGVPADRIHTVSFGKDKPAESGHNEAAWSKNRRGEFVLVLP